MTTTTMTIYVCSIKVIIVYFFCKQGEVKLPVILEDDATRELPSYIDLYRPVRQSIYSVLLNLNKQKIVHEIQNKEKGKSVPLIEL